MDPPAAPAALTTRPGHPLWNRRNALRLMFAGAAGAAANAVWLEPARLSVTRTTIRCAGLPAALDGLRVGVLADFHFKPGADEELVAGAVAALAREQPDLVMLPGDFIDADPRVLDPLLELLGPLAPAHGVFAAMGNHDGWHGQPAAIRRRFERAGIPFLINHHTLLAIRGERLAIAATDHVWRGRPDPDRTLRGIPKDVPVLALVHEPDYFDTLRTHRDITLQLSGHTHGGQCRVPLLGWAPVRPHLGRKYVHGTFARGASRLFVTRGLGTTGPRVRFACPPELALLTLRAGQDC